jgi:hypothetical protein
MFEVVRGYVDTPYETGSIKVQLAFPRALFGIFGAIRAECFLAVTGATLPFTAVNTGSIVWKTYRNLLKLCRVAALG